MSDNLQNEVWAQVDDNGVVVNTIVATKDMVDMLHGTFINAGPNNAMLACIGDTWDGENFVSPQPFPSWVLVDRVWVAPKPHPEVPNPMIWNEDAQDWVDNPLHPNTEN